MRKITTLLIATAMASMSMNADTLYLMGYNNNWGGQESCKFTPTATDGVYQLHIGTLDGNTIQYGFKLATVSNTDPEGEWIKEWGAAEAVKIDIPIQCEPGSSDNNFYLPNHYNSGQNISYLASATLIFDMNQQTLLIDPDLYIAGECTNWDNTNYSYRFKNNGDGTHTFSSATSINGNFKIAAGAKQDWTVEYGGDTNMSAGNTYSLIPGPGNDMSISGSFKTIVVDRNANTITISNDGTTEPENPVEPDPNERGPELYLTGQFNSWTPNQEAYHFTQHNIYEYVLELSSLESMDEGFKVTSSNWEHQFGCDDPIILGETYSCVRANDGHNMKLAEGSAQNVTITFDYKNQTIKIDAMPALYLVGDVTGWEKKNAYKFSQVNGIYQLRTSNFTGEFKIESDDDLGHFGGYNDDFVVELNNEQSVNHSSNTDTYKHLQFNGLSNPDNKVLITINPNSGIPTVISSPFAEEEGDFNFEIEYYNLHGMKVANPQHGIFIRKAGNKVEKVIIK